jgi:probable F420-dependent oxidoreductase
MSAKSASERLGKVGVWSMEMRFGDPAVRADAAARIEAMGYGALWIPGGIDDAVLGDVGALLDATSRMTIGTGIINIWKQQAADVAAWFAAQSPDRQARTMLGIGVSHGPIIGESWAKPLAITRDWLEKAAAAGMAMDNVSVAALGPKMVELAGKLTAGVHPYLVTPEHSRRARAILGPGKLIAPEQGVVLSADPGHARDLARKALDHYRFLPNYRNNWLRLGFTEAEIEGLDDRLIDGLFAWGSPAQIAARVKEHHDAGADHVCVQVITGANMDIGVLVDQLGELAGALL